MFHTRSEYDRGVNTFSPEGRLFQVEYALEAIKLGSTAIGIRCRDGVLLAVEKKITSPLLEPASIEKLYKIDDHVGCAVSGLTPDARTMIEHARVEAASHHFMYNEPIPTESLTQAVCDLALRFGEGAHGQRASMSRPFGVALLVAGFNDLLEEEFPEHGESAQQEQCTSGSASPQPQLQLQPQAAAAAAAANLAPTGPQLYHADPSGTFVAWAAKAIGAGSEGAQEELQREYKKDITLVEGENLAIKILGKIMEQKITPKNIEIASVTREKGYITYNDEEVKTVIDRISAI